MSALASQDAVAAAAGACGRVRSAPGPAAGRFAARPAQQTKMTDMDANYTVSGMHCQHCVEHVKAEVSAIPGVRRVAVDLDGHLSLTAKQPVDFALVQAAVAEAGEYTVVPA